MEKSSFFNSVNGDRKYKAEEFARYFASFIGNGIFPNPSTNCQVLSNNDMTIRISAGKAWINGYYYENTGNMNHVLEPADSVLDRIDRVVLRWDKLERRICSYVKVGEYSSNPKPKALQRNVDAYELCLADVKVSAGATTVTQASITDTRLDSDLCGVVHGVVDQVDTTTLFNQYLSWYQEQQNKYEADLVSWTSDKKNQYNNWYDDITTNAETDIENIKQQFQDDINLFLDEWQQWFTTTTGAKEQEFDTWFNRIKDILDENTAGNLLNLINENKQNIDTKMDKKIPDESYVDRRYELTVIEGKPYLRTVN